VSAYSILRIFLGRRWRAMKKKAKKVKCRYLFNEIKYFPSLRLLFPLSKSCFVSRYSTLGLGEAHLKATLTFLLLGASEGKKQFIFTLILWGFSPLTTRLSHSSNLHFVCPRRFFISRIEKGFIMGAFWRSGFRLTGREEARWG
jgi:hypothetical protein